MKAITPFNKLIIIVMLSSFCLSVNAQKVDTDATIDCIKEHCITFFIEIGKLDNKEDIKDNYGNISLVEIVEKSVLGYKENGMYYLGNRTSHEPKYLVLKKGRKFKIITFKDIPRSLKDIADFMEDIELNDNEIIKYLNEVAKLLDSNQLAMVNDSLSSNYKWKKCN